MGNEAVGAPRIDGEKSVSLKVIGANRVKLGELAVLPQADPHSDEAASWNRQIIQPDYTMTTQQGEQ